MFMTAFRLVLQSAVYLFQKCSGYTRVVGSFLQFSQYAWCLRVLKTTVCVNATIMKSDVVMPVFTSFSLLFTG